MPHFSHPVARHFPHFPRHFVRRLLVLCLGLTGLLAGTAASAQMRLDPAFMNLFGGTYSANCGDPAAPYARVEADALIVGQGSAPPLVARNAHTMLSNAAHRAQPDYMATLQAEVRPWIGLEFVIYRDPLGQYLRLEGDPAVLSQLGPALSQAPLRSCDPVLNKRAAAGPPRPEP
jgi:hypothetical protein